MNAMNATAEFEQCTMLLYAEYTMSCYNRSAQCHNIAKLIEYAQCSPQTTWKAC